MNMNMNYIYIYIYIYIGYMIWIPLLFFLQYLQHIEESNLFSKFLIFAF